MKFRIHIYIHVDTWISVELDTSISIDASLVFIYPLIVHKAQLFSIILHQLKFQRLSLRLVTGLPLSSQNLESWTS